MKKFIYSITIIAIALSATSCQTSSAIHKENTEVAGYTLKNKKELFHQKVLHKKTKTVIAIP